VAVEVGNRDPQAHAAGAVAVAAEAGAVAALAAEAGAVEVEEVSVVEDEGESRSTGTKPRVELILVYAPEGHFKQQRIAKQGELQCQR
jgi:hypothetical protein